MKLLLDTNVAIALEDSGAEVSANAAAFARVCGRLPVQLFVADPNYRDVARDRSGPPVLLLDGHCVIDNGKELVPIPVDVVGRLGVAAVVYLTGFADKIRARRRSDSRRRRPDLDEAEVSRHQESGLAACASYSIRLGLPMMVVSAAEYELIVTLAAYVAGTGMIEGNCR